MDFPPADIHVIFTYMKKTKETQTAMECLILHNVPESVANFIQGRTPGTVGSIALLSESETGGSMVCENHTKVTQCFG
jgi:hypothetical protein